MPTRRRSSSLPWACPPKTDSAPLKRWSSWRVTPPGANGVFDPMLGRRWAAAAWLLVGLASVGLGPTAFAQATRDAASEQLYRQAVDELTASDSQAKALARLAESFAAGLPRPSRVLVEAAWEPIRREPETRRQLWSLLRDHARESEIEMVAADEPGRRLELTLEFRDRDSGKPLIDRVVSLYHTDDAGDYTPEATSAGGGADNPRLFACGRTDADGRLRVHTIVPGHYRGTQAPRHIHLGLQRPDQAAYGTGIYFESGENGLDEELREERAQGRVFAATLPPGDEPATVRLELRIPAK